jgi:hypothetical protein
VTDISFLHSLWSSLVAWYSSPDTKVLPLVGVVVGWVLAQFTDIMRYWWRKRRLRKALYQEVWDVGRRLGTTRTTCATLIQLLTHKAVGNEIPLPIPTHIFDTHYAEVSVDLSEHERVAFATIFSTIKNLNSDRDLLERLCRECAGDHRKAEAFSYVADTMYLRSSRALLQGRLLWEHRKRVPVESNIKEDDEIVAQLRALKEAGKNKTKEEIKREIER